MSELSILEQLNEVNKRVSIKEGVFGILRTLAVISRFAEEPMRKVAQESNLPVPICVAIRNEFEKLGWVSKEEKGALLTQTGHDIIKSLGGHNEDFSCSKCKGLGVSIPYSKFLEELEHIKRYSSMRNHPLTQFDQSFATPRTSLSRVLYMGHNYDLFRRNFAFLGDSDLTSIVLALFANKFSKIVVFDIDQRLKEIIESANRENALQIEFVEHDLRKPIPAKYHKKFDCISTDPPYTIHGLNLFISRGLSLLSDEHNGVGYLSFGVKPPSEALELEKSLLQMNCVITDIVPKFNQYIGAQKLGGVSTLYRFEVIQPATPLIQKEYDGSLYTGEINPIIRTYECHKCKSNIEIGINQSISTIEDLKNKGCPHCGNESFSKTRERKME
ncbi:MAG: bis-aminopropyl spermidine synthase family protein [Candidatus Heimdallarchaeota archaeon]|nr:bis-aminopropyl spermidine synthase family protein [Candidatus Heimdallarchaeota archaeon]